MDDFTARTSTTGLMCATIRDAETGIELQFDPEITLAEAYAKLTEEVKKHYASEKQSTAEDDANSRTRA